MKSVVRSKSNETVLEIIEFIGVVYRLTATLRYRLRSPNPFSRSLDILSELISARSIHCPIKSKFTHTALSRSCRAQVLPACKGRALHCTGCQPNSAPSIKTTRQLSKINPYAGRCGGRRFALCWGVWGASPPAPTRLNTIIKIDLIDYHSYSPIAFDTNYLKKFFNTTITKATNKTVTTNLTTTP
jgi:hypothetical protein